MKKVLLHFLFVVIVVGVIIGEYSQNSQIGYIFKPLILIWIGVYFLIHSKGMDKKVVTRAILAFLFSWAGDVLLMFGSEFIYFILGLSSFLVAQVFFVFLFLRTINISGKRSFLKKKPVWLIPYIAFGLIIYIALFPKLDVVLRGAVFVYMVALLGMSATALNRYGNGHPISFSLVFTGSLLFVASDTLLAINRFLVDVPFDGYLVMGSYIVAQYLIMIGLLKQYE